MLELAGAYKGDEALPGVETQQAQSSVLLHHLGNPWSRTRSGGKSPLCRRQDGSSGVPGTSGCRSLLAGLSCSSREVPPRAVAGNLADLYQVAKHDAQAPLAGRSVGAVRPHPAMGLAAVQGRRQVEGLVYVERYRSVGHRLGSHDSRRPQCSLVGYGTQRRLS